MKLETIVEIIKIPIISKIFLTICSPVIFLFQDDPNVPIRSYGQIIKDIWKKE